MKKSISHTYSYNMLNNNQIINKNFKTIMDNGMEITKTEIMLQYETIKSHFSTTLKHRVLSGIDDGTIILKYTDNVKMPISLPFITTIRNGKMCSVIFTDLFSNYSDKTKTINIETNKLYVLCESAITTRGIIGIKSSAHINRDVVKSGSKIFSALTTRILNKAYALNTNTLKLDKVTFIMACFFLINILEITTEDIVKNYATQCCKSPNQAVLDNFYKEFTNTEESPFINISTFLTRLSSMEDLDLKGLGVRNFIASFINTYGSSCLLALESYEMLFYMASSVIHKAFLNNGSLILPTVGERDLDKFYNGTLETIADNI